jgi:LPS sulfotransferase NodH
VKNENNISNTYHQPSLLDLDEATSEARSMIAFYQEALAKGSHDEGWSKQSLAGQYHFLTEIANRLDRVKEGVETLKGQDCIGVISSDST